MRRNLLAWIPVAGVLIQLAVCTAAIAANVKSTTTVKAKYRVTGVVKDALGRPLKQADLSLQGSTGKVVAHVTSNDAGEFTFDAIAPGTYAVVATKEGFKTATAIVPVSAKGAAPVVVAMEAEKAVSLKVAATRLNKARNSLSPDTGGSKYTFTQQAIQELPQGANTSLNQVILQAPGVAQDSYGQLHVRGDHANLQYRINGVQLPEGITGFGQILSPRFAQSISLLTGALPAEYGLRTAGVIDIKTKDGLLDPVADVDFYGGQRGTTQPSFEYGGSKGNFSYFMTGQYLGTDRGIEPPTSGPTAIHDTSNQGSFFGYFSYFLNPTMRLSLITGSAINHFQIPANPDQPQVFALAGVPSYPSAKIRDNQFEQNYFNVLALQGTVGENIDYQIAPFTRYSTVTFNPDHVGDLIYNGAASKVFRSDWGSGFQIDTAYHGIANHTFRLGGYFDAERAEIDNHEATFPIVGGVPLTTPVSFVDDIGLQTWIYSGYIQDEWKLTEKLTFNYGVRFDLYDGLVRADQASPRAAFEYKLFKGTTLHAGYSRQMTPPETELVQVGNIKQLKNTTGAPPSNGNGTPTVERDHLFDAGVTQEVIPGLNIGIDSYYKKAVDLIDEGQFGPALIFETFNYAKGRVYGVEFTGSYTHENIYALRELRLERGAGYAGGIRAIQLRAERTGVHPAVTISSSITIRPSPTPPGSFTTGANGCSASTEYMAAGSGAASSTPETCHSISRSMQASRGECHCLITGARSNFAARSSNLADHTYLVRNGTGVGVFANQFGPRRAIYGGIKWELPFTKPASAVAP